MSLSAHPDTTAIVLAAGRGTRMGSDLAKVLHPLAGRPLLAHVLTTCQALRLGRTLVVVGWQREQVEVEVRRFGATPVVQDRQLGTGHAVRMAEQEVIGSTVLVLCGDCPLTPPLLLDQLLCEHARSDADCTAVAARMADPTGYGRMVVADGRLTRIVEHKDASPAERAIDLVNSGIYAFRREPLFRCLAEVRPTNQQGEYYLTDVVGMLVAEGRRVGLITTEDASAVLGVNTPADLTQAEHLLRSRAGAA